MLKVKNLKKHFRPSKKLLKAVDDVSFEIKAGETLGLVGESGSGKSTLGKMLLSLYKPTSGEIYFEDKNLASLSRKEQKLVQRDMQIIFQDPYSSLNPKLTIEEIIKEPLLIHRTLPKNEQNRRVDELLELTKLPLRSKQKYPYEFSGGERQRIGIARALALSPKFIVCDEPISALDVSIQAQIMNLLEDLQKELGLTYLFIAHDLAMVRHISTRVAVMYLGKIVELAPTEELFSNPKHPYTEALLSSYPELNTRTKKSNFILTGDIPSPLSPPSGCKFHTRCPKALFSCSEKEPKLKEIKRNHLGACHLD